MNARLNARELHTVMLQKQVADNSEQARDYMMNGGIRSLSHVIQQEDAIVYAAIRARMGMVEGLVLDEVPELPIAKPTQQKFPRTHNQLHARLLLLAARAILPDDEFMQKPAHERFEELKAGKYWPTPTSAYLEACALAKVHFDQTISRQLSSDWLAMPGTAAQLQSLSQFLLLVTAEELRTRDH